MEKLNVEDLNWENCSAIVNGKGSKQREVYFTSECKVWLKKYLASRDDLCKALFVTDAHPTRRMAIPTIRWAVKRIADRGEIEANVYPHRLDHIPIIWEEPDEERNGHLVIWLPGMTGSMDELRSHLRMFADAGFLAVSYDPYEHGERMRESRELFIGKLRSNKRRFFWPMIAMTAEEYPRVMTSLTNLPMTC
ncbi:hypothetical protein J23TS9_12500 [Paenibacillus sp. J23TS9]|nr:hypothetical protein J23TS9_12500 [Paenibacillus sp. J23TS9]